MMAIKTIPTGTATPIAMGRILLLWDARAGVLVLEGMLEVDGETAVLEADGEAAAPLTSAGSGLVPLFKSYLEHSALGARGQSLSVQIDWGPSGPPGVMAACGLHRNVNDLLIRVLIVAASSGVNPTTLAAPSTCSMK